MIPLLRRVPTGATQKKVVWDRRSARVSRAPPCVSGRHTLADDRWTAVSWRQLPTWCTTRSTATVALRAYRPRHRQARTSRETSGHKTPAESARLDYTRDGADSARRHRRTEAGAIHVVTQAPDPASKTADGEVQPARSPATQRPTHSHRYDAERGVSVCDSYGGREE